MAFDPSVVNAIVHSPELGGRVILDPDVLAALIDLGGEDDPGLLEELVELFVQDTAQRVRTAVSALVRGDLVAIGRAGHAMKSAAANLGALPFSEACRELETVARGGGATDEHVARVARMFEEVERALLELTRSLTSDRPIH